MSDHGIVSPQLLGRSGLTAISGGRRVTHLPSDPRRGQDAPPKASTVASGFWVTGPDGLVKSQDSVCIPACPYMIEGQV